MTETTSFARWLERELAARRINRSQLAAYMFAMFAGRCSVCGGSFPAGADIAYNRAGRSARHIACGATAPGMRRLDCGHTLPVGSVLIMAASTGSACPDCYDRMSD